MLGGREKYLYEVRYDMNIRNAVSWLMGIMLAISLCMVGTTARAAQPPTLIFIPIDNRPITDLYSAQTMEQVGYKVLVPPDEILGGNTNDGDVDALWNWLDKVAEEDNIKAAVISSDSLLYGSLVASRRHNISVDVLHERINRFKNFHQQHPELKLYVFSSIMRTPVQGSPGGKEPEYYVKWGASIFDYSALTDKAETGKLSKKEQKQLDYDKWIIPQEVMEDWLGRRKKNFEANKALIDMARDGTFRYFALGRDDNSPLSQTHMEGRKLKEYGKDLDFTKYQNMNGIDEIGLLLLTKAYNDYAFEMPFVYVEYNTGIGKDMVPAYADEKISLTIEDYIRSIGGLSVPTAKRADLVLMMNTPEKGNGGIYGGDKRNVMEETPRSRKFVDRVTSWLDSGKNTGIADVTYYNGSDNSLCIVLRNRKLLYRLGAYAGWNTATNSLGYAISQGTLAPKMTTAGKNFLLTIRYLDEWAYEANIRQMLGPYASTFGPDAFKTNLGEIELRGSDLQQRFARDHLSEYPDAINYRMILPWQRLFENKIITN